MPPTLPAEWPLACRLVLGVLLGLLLQRLLSLPLAAAAVVALQLYLPIWRCDHHGLEVAAVGLTRQQWQREVALALGLAALCLPPFWAGLQLLGAGTAMPLCVKTPQAVWTMATGLFTQLLGVALPEETFFRGYLQAQLQRRWPPRRRLAGVPVGLGLHLGAALFALAHLLGRGSPLGLLTYFPALLFGWLRNRRGSVLGAALLHALFNLGVGR